MRKKKRTLSLDTRKRLYEVSIAGVAVAVGYGVVDGEHGLLWLTLIGAVLGIARANAADPAEPENH